MRPFPERIQQTAAAPSDVVQVNDQLMHHQVDSTYAERYIELHRSSWEGVRGPFDGSLVAVGSDFVVNAATMRDGPAKTFIAIGHLGPLQVVTVDIRIPQHVEPGESELRYKGDVIAAELSPAPRQANYAEFIEEDSFAILSLRRQPYWVARFDRITPNKPPRYLKLLSPAS